jgi:hypothetical protein
MTKAIVGSKISPSFTHATPCSYSHYAKVLTPLKTYSGVTLVFDLQYFGPGPTSLILQVETSKIVLEALL